MTTEKDSPMDDFQPFPYEVNVDKKRVAILWKDLSEIGKVFQYTMGVRFTPLLKTIDDRDIERAFDFPKLEKAMWVDLKTVEDVGRLILAQAPYREDTTIEDIEIDTFDLLDYDGSVTETYRGQYSIRINGRTYYSTFLNNCERTALLGAFLIMHGQFEDVYRRTQETIDTGLEMHPDAVIGITSDVAYLINAVPEVEEMHVPPGTIVH